MKRISVLLLSIIIFGNISAQQSNISKDVLQDPTFKSEEKSKYKSNTILVSLTHSKYDDSDGIGIKYQYCRKFGAYFDFRTGFNKSDTKLITVGLAKSISKIINLYAGCGINTYSTEYSSLHYNEHIYDKGGFTYEGGILLKIYFIAIDFGITKSDLHTIATPLREISHQSLTFTTFGVGFNF